MSTPGSLPRLGAAPFAAVAAAALLSAAPAAGAADQRKAPPVDASIRSKSAPKQDAAPVLLRAPTTASKAPEGSTRKRTAAHDGAASSSRSRLGQRTPKKAAPPRPCVGPYAAFDRSGLEPERFPLVDCRGGPLASARDRLSVLARPWGVTKPAALPAPRLLRKIGESEPVELVPGVRLVDAGLLSRLAAIAKRFPGRAISIVSGVRPASRGSQHQVGRALDLRVAGVRNEEIVAFCKTLKDTGCGYYPNSSFVHVDVRNPGTGPVAWIDASGPGEPPRYVTSWPPRAHAKPAPAPEIEPAHEDPRSDGAAHAKPGETLVY
jgi:hypothetical protein